MSDDNAHGVIKGIGAVTCVYINPESDQFWIIESLQKVYDCPKWVNLLGNSG